MLEESEEAYNEMVTWLQVGLHHQQPQSKQLEYWKRTAKSRLQFIHGEDVPDLCKIWKQWPRYKDREGFLLVYPKPFFSVCMVGFMVSGIPTVGQCRSGVEFK